MLYRNRYIYIYIYFSLFIYFSPKVHRSCLIVHSFMFDNQKHALFYTHLCELLKMSIDIGNIYRTCTCKNYMTQDCVSLNTPTNYSTNVSNATMICQCSKYIYVHRNPLRNLAKASVLFLAGCSDRYYLFFLIIIIVNATSLAYEIFFSSYI